MRILLLSHSPDNPDAGASSVIHSLLGALAARGHETEAMHLEQLHLPSNPKLSQLLQRTAMPAIASRAARTEAARADVIIAASGMAAPLGRAFSGRQKRPLIINLTHGLAKYDFAANLSEDALRHIPVSLLQRAINGPAQRRWDQRGIVGADANVVQNRRDLAEVSAAALGKPVEMIPPCLDNRLFDAARSHARSAPGGTRLLWFGTWEARKGAFYVPAALRAIRQVEPDVHLTIGGTGLSREALLSAFDADDRQAVEVLPKVSRSQQIEVFQQHDIFVFPSISEGFGLALVEAMSFGLVPVATPTGVAADSIEDGVHGRIVAPSALHIAEAVLHVVRDHAAAMRYSQAARDLALSYSSDRMGAAYDEFIVRLADPAVMRAERSPAPPF